jgi:hypothetical protein
VFCYVQEFGVKRAIEQHNINGELHLSDEVSPRSLGKSLRGGRVIGSNL